MYCFWRNTTTYLPTYLEYKGTTNQIDVENEPPVKKKSCNKH